MPTATEGLVASRESGPERLPALEVHRLRSLDVFRGATIAFMILVNNAGDWGATWGPLLHAPWHGWTPTDLVFPFFLFIVGAAIPFALGPRLESGSADFPALRRKIAKRSALLFLLGLALIWFPFYTVAWERARVPGVLQRIALVYLVAALAYLHLNLRGRAILAVTLLAGYWAAMKLIPVEGFAAGDLSPEGNLAFRIDHLVLGPHIWRYSPGPGDPEGIFSTVPAIVSALAGIFAGELLRRNAGRNVAREAPRTLTYLTLAGAVLVLLGLALAPLFPINKNLWSPTYVLFTTGAALLALAATHFLVDVRRIEAWSRPFAVFGRNAILAYVGSGALARLLTLVKLPSGPGAGPNADAGVVSLQAWLYSRLFEPCLPDPVASFGWALACVLLWLGILWRLDRRGLYLRL